MAAADDDPALEAPPALLVVIAALAVVEAAGIPEVNGTALPEEAPEKATDWVDAVGTGVAVDAAGLRTLWEG